MKFFTAFVITLLMLSVCVSCEKDKPGEKGKLVAYYPFDGNAYDASRNGHNGIVHGAELTDDRHGESQKAYYFDGNLSYIDLGNSLELKRYMSDYSLSGWIKINSYPPTYNSIIISNKNPDTDPKSGSFIGIGGLLSSLSKRIEFVQNTILTDDEFTFDFMSSNTQVELDTWYFFCVTYEYNGNLSNRIRIYVNGLLESQKLMGEILDPGDVNTYLGCEPELYPVDYSFHGSMDEIKIFDYALSEEEVMRLYGQ